MRCLTSALKWACAMTLAGAAVSPIARADSFPFYPFPAIEIPNQQDARAVPEFIGTPAVAEPVVGYRPIPDNPFMWPGAWSAIHNDTYMSDTYTTPGPLGIEPEVLSTWLSPSATDPSAIVVVLTFDRNGLIVAAAIKTSAERAESHVQLTLIRPSDLATLATFDLPPEEILGSNFRPAGAYFFNDSLDRTVIGTKDRTVIVVTHARNALTGAWSFHQEATWPLTDAIRDGDSVEALQPDWSGRLWFTSKGGVVGTLDHDGNMLGYTTELADRGERIVNGHASDEDGGVYVVSTLAMYRFDADAAGRPAVTWREPYDAGTHVKQGQVDVGSGTTPTLMGSDYVTITDSGQPRMHVLVYRRAKHVEGARLVCAEPVFRPGSASNENSLVATDTSIVVENNFGYGGYLETTHGRTTTPGLARVDVEDGACRTVWTNESISIPTLVTKMSLANGLIYTYTKPKGPATTDPWYFTAVDFHTGEVVYQRLAGTGALYNNHYAAAYLGSDGTMYVGVLGGIVAMRDIAARR